MTTMVRVENMEESGHDIEVRKDRDGIKVIGPELIKPGTSLEYYLYDNATLTIREVSN